MSVIDHIPVAVARFFPGVLPEDIEQEYPMYPLDAPGMPPPGPDFLLHAQALGDPPIKVGRGKKQATGYGLNVTTLYRAALYYPDFSTPVAGGGDVVDESFVSGHLLAHDNRRAGPQPADVMILGKHPGRDEVARRRNFVCPTSMELFKALDEAGVKDQEYGSWYAANVVRHNNRDPSRAALPADWLKNCLPILHQELRLVRPKFLLCLGAEAIKAVLGRGVRMVDAIGRIYDLRIPVHRSSDEPEEYHDIRVVCCSHPAKIAREPELYDKPEFLGSVRLFVDLVHGTRTGAEEEGLERDYIRDEATLDQVVARVKSETTAGGVFALDCEWHGAYPWDAGAYLRTVQFSHRGKYAAVLVLRQTGGAPSLDLRPEYVRTKLLELLKSSPERPIGVVGHNLKADLPWLLHLGVDLRSEFEAPADDPDPDGQERLFGWQKTAHAGGFDTLYAAHAHTETGPFKLEVLASMHLGTLRYDAPLQQWLKDYCKEHKLKRDDIDGYGDVPEEILLNYAAMDSDVTRRLYDVYNGTPTKPGLLDLDKFGNNCREAFWVSQRAAPAALEIETTGLLVDRTLVEQQIRTFQIARDRLLSELQQRLGWAEFNPDSSYHRIEFLFGEQYGKKDEDGRPVRVRPEGARSLGLTPVATTDGKAWAQRRPGARPSTDKTAIGALAGSCEEVRIYRDLRFVAQSLKTVLRPPVMHAPTKPVPDDEADAAVEVEAATGDEGTEVYEGGLLSFVGADDRVRTRVFPVETGRWSSSKPNLMNFSSARDADYQRILGSDFVPLRSLFMAPPGHVLIEADYTGAELAVTAWLSDDRQLIDHCERALLPESDPNYYDIHSSIAVTAFNLSCPPTKKGLKGLGMSHLRTAAKRRVFGLFYGQSDEGALLKIQEECPQVALSEVRQTTEGIHRLYPRLEPFFAACRARVANPGWVCNPFGRFRRFAYTQDRQRLAELERQCMNYPVQSSVSDAISRSLDNLCCWRRETGTHFNILLQVHDAVLLSAPAENAVRVYEEALPECMCKRVPIYPCTLDGRPRPGVGPRRLGIDRKIGLRWGEPLTAEQAGRLGLPLRYATGE